MVDVKIEKLGKKGDGIFQDEGREMFVPFTLPGETVSVDISGKNFRLSRVVEASVHRVPPICLHFIECGGCQLQHLEKDYYQDWKLDVLYEALASHGIDFKPEPLLSFADASRRRATFLASRIDGEFRLGFAKAGSHEIVPLSQCPVLVPALERLLPEIAEIAKMLPIGKRPVRIPALMTETGLDLGIEGLRPPDENLRKALINQALQKGFARLSVEDEILVEARKPVLFMGIAKVTPPPSGFVQASAEAEAVMADLVCGHLGRCKSVIDLYSGIGTFALRLAQRSTVWALEENNPGLQALDRAWRETAGKLKQVTTEARNLERRPVSFQEMKKHDGLVFDPPRAGAELQSRQIAKSKIGKVAAVSCNPVTLARDLAILLEGGYRLCRIIPVDQFRYTPHLEIVALLEK